MTDAGGGVDVQRLLMGWASRELKARGDAGSFGGFRWRALAAWS